MKTPSRKEQFEQYWQSKFPCEPPCDSHGNCDNCNSMLDAFIGLEWADQNPDDWAFTQQKLECAKAYEMLALAVEALKYIGNSIPGPEQTFELENKRAAQVALDKINEMKEK